MRFKRHKKKKKTSKGLQCAEYDGRVRGINFMRERRERRKHVFCNNFLQLAERKKNKNSKSTTGRERL